MSIRSPSICVIVGGSYIGLEFAQMYRRFGSAVTVVEMADAADRARGRGRVGGGAGNPRSARESTIRLNAECIASRRDGDGVAMQRRLRQEPQEVNGSHLLLAVGRRPNTDDLGLRARRHRDRRSAATSSVDESSGPTSPGIWALGDVNGRGAFTHTSYNDYEIVAANLLDGDERRVSDRIPAYALYIDPPLGRVGMTEREARASGRRR